PRKPWPSCYPTLYLEAKATRSASRLQRAPRRYGSAPVAHQACRGKGHREKPPLLAKHTTSGWGGCAMLSGPAASDTPTAAHKTGRIIFVRPRCIGILSFGLSKGEVWLL